MGTARPLAKLNAMTDQQRIESLKRRLTRAQARYLKAEARADEAERNANRFHALLLKERIQKIQGGAR